MMIRKMICLLLTFGLLAMPALAGLAFRSQSQAQDVHGEINLSPKRQLLKESDCGIAPVSFEQYIQKHKRTYAAGSEEYLQRKVLFEQRAAEAHSHNCKPGRRIWKAGINRLSDRTDAELDKLRGRKGGLAASDGHPTSGGGQTARERLATLESEDAEIGHRGDAMKGTLMPKSFSWSNLKAMNELVDQGACGSCWASATVKLLEAHAEIYSQPVKLSLQQIVSCAPNPEECGGNGGCNGSTGELALDYVMNNGLVPDSQFDYAGYDVKCPHSLIARNPYPVPQPNFSSFLMIRSQPKEPRVSPRLSPARSFGMIGWNRLPVNKLAPLFKSLYTEGPIAVSVVAGRSWNMYDSGVMDDCTKDTLIVNHLVVLYGYGEDGKSGEKYWNIQNSWGTGWGENGHIRMVRRDYDEEQALCGVDDDPQVGTGCKDGPSQVWVCGSCGILYDNVVPHFHGNTPRAIEMLQRRSTKYVMPS